MRRSMPSQSDGERGTLNLSFALMTAAAFAIGMSVFSMRQSQAHILTSELTRNKVWNKFVAESQLLLANPESCRATFAGFDFAGTTWQRVDLRYSSDPHANFAQQASLIGSALPNAAGKSRLPSLKMNVIQARVVSQTPTASLLEVGLNASAIGADISARQKYQKTSRFFVSVMQAPTGGIDFCTSGNYRDLVTDISELETALAPVEARAANLTLSCPAGQSLIGYQADGTPKCGSLHWITESANLTWDGVDRADHQVKCPEGWSIYAFHMNHNGSTPGTGNVNARCIKFGLN